MKMTAVEKKLAHLSFMAGYLAGFTSSGDGYNGEYPYTNNDGERASDDPVWCRRRLESAQAYIVLLKKSLLSRARPAAGHIKRKS